MESDARQFFETLLATPSPSGFESRIQDVVRAHVESFADEIRGDYHGNLMVGRNTGAEFRVMLSGHCDQIGLIVQHIDSDGYIYCLSIGGWDIQMLMGQRVTIWNHEGAVQGIIGRKPIHLLTDEERKKVPKLHELWVDIGAADEEEARNLVHIGDPVTIDLVRFDLRNERIASPATDDKAGLFVVMEALRRIDPSKLKVAVYAVSTVQEEVGLRGARTSAFGIDPHVGVAVDVTHATDCPTIEKKQEGDIRLGRGPVIYRGPNMNCHVVDRLIQAAKASEIPYQEAAEGRATGTDANAIQVTRAGVATGLVSIPNRYMHTPVEMISKADIDHGADLLARFVEGLTPDANFIP